MYCLIQFYIQLRKDLAAHSPFLKVLAIKLVIFLSFWQSFLLSFLTSSSLGILKASSTLAYPDLVVGIPSLLLCVEMAIFAALHLFAFPWQPYKVTGAATKYPSPGTLDAADPGYNQTGENQGGFLGVKAFADAMNPWDLVKGFGRGMRWMFVGVRHREEDMSYHTGSVDLSTKATDTSYKSPQGLPIADQFRQSKFGLQGHSADQEESEAAALMAHAQQNPSNVTGSGYTPAKDRYDAQGADIYPNDIGVAVSPTYKHHSDWSMTSSNDDRLNAMHPSPAIVRQESYDIGIAHDGGQDWQQRQQQQYAPQYAPPNVYVQRPQQAELHDEGATQFHAHQMLWGQQAPVEGMQAPNLRQHPALRDEYAQQGYPDQGQGYGR